MTVKGISPLDGRYAQVLRPLDDTFSEFALMRERCVVELRYLQALDVVGVFPSLSMEEMSRIERALASFTDADFAQVKAHEAATNHDVKACELFLREKLKLSHPDRIHFGLTSADINNLAYARLLKRYRDEHQLPQLRRLIEVLTKLADDWKAVPFPARTHGQAASPTTAGKEIAVFVSRLLRQAKQLEAHRFRGKLNGATGTYAALVAAAPRVDWPAFSQAFVQDMDLEWSPCTTQIEANDALAEYLGLVARINTIVLDLDLDLWHYISHGDIRERTAAQEVGSSTMPHKVNPIRFESSEGNAVVANALLHALADKLAQSRMQRDLSGSTVERNVGVALAHSYLAVSQTLAGLDRIDLDRDAARDHVEASPEVLAEAIQTILRTEDVADPYTLLKTLTRGRTVSLKNLHAWIEKLDVPRPIKARLKSLQPDGYLGLAERICEDTVREARAWLEG